MVSEELIRKQFIHQIIHRDLDVIYNTQALALQKAFPGRAFRTLSLLSQRNYRITGFGLNITYQMNIPLNIRLFDIWRRSEKTLLYNRAVWGILYRQTMPDLRYGLSQDIKNTIGARLEKMNPGNRLISQ